MAEFRTIHTTLGHAAIAEAEATGTPINLTHMAVGDGNGNPVTPTVSQTVLVRERFRAAINRVFQSPNEPNRFTAELVIPASEGGFTLREVGVFNDAGGLFAVGNLPDTYKPNMSEGAYADTVVRLDFLVTNTSIITLQVDPNVAVATQQWITNNITAETIIPGGTTEQVLAKQSNADGDYIWKDPTSVNVTVNSIEEAQTLAADQTVIDWVVVNNTGLAVYVEGVRLRADEWEKDAVINTRITLSEAYPAGTKVVGAQNEPAGTLPDPLVKGQNLADLPNKATARTNLGVYSRAESDARGKQPGDIFYTAGDTAPARSFKANGAAVSRTVYADLFARIGTRFGAGDGFSTFNLPDGRGEFIRAWDDGRGVDAGRGLGTWQNTQNLWHGHTGATTTNGNHAHGVNDPGHAHGGTGQIVGGTGIDAGSNQIRWIWKMTEVSGTGISIQAAGDHWHSFTTNGDGANESRPRNVAFLMCIAY